MYRASFILSPHRTIRALILLLTSTYRHILTKHTTVKERFYLLLSEVNFPNIESSRLYVFSWVSDKKQTFGRRNCRSD